MKNMLIAVAGGLMLAAAPAQAGAREPESAAPKPAEVAQEASAPKAARYCVVRRAVTGTLLARKVCNTRDGWRAQGFDPLAK